MDNWKRLEGESDIEWEIRICLAKKRNQCDLDWSEIIDLLKLDISPDQLRKQAVGYVRYDDYIKGYQSVATRILSISDLHVPFQLPIETFKDYIGITDILQINGDLCDCLALSKFTKLYRVDPMLELIEARQYLINLVEYINPRQVIITTGNHDERFGKYFAKKLDTDFLNKLLPTNSIELMVEDGFHYYDVQSKTKTYYPPLQEVFTDVKIIYAHDWKVKIGKTWFCHPLAFRSGILSTAQKAKSYLQDIDKEPFNAVIMAHTHRVGETKIGNVYLYEQGACCYVDKMAYTDGRMQQPQKEGFMFICQDKDGNLIKDKTKLIELN